MTERFFAQVLTTGQPILNVEVVVPTLPDRVWLGNYFPVHTVQGDLLGVGCTVLDITDRKNIERELQASQDFLRQVTDTAPIMIFMFDVVQHRAVFSNLYQQELTGISDARLREMGPQELVSLVHPDEQQGTLAFFQQLAQLPEGSSLSREYRVRNKDGQWRWMTARTTVFSRAPDGSSVVVLGAALDTTDRKHTEAALQESERRFRHMADTAPVMIWMSSVNGDTAFYNKFWLEFRGRTSEQELGTGWMEGIHPDDLAGALRVFEENAAKLEPFEMEFRLKRFDGQYRWIVDRGVPRFTEDGTFLGFIGACIDIHDRKLAQEAMEQLMQAQKRFVADAAHELRTPLTSIQGNLDILFRYPDIEGAEKQEILRDVQREATRLGRLVHDMLTLARGDSGLAFKEEEIELHQICLAAWREMERIQTRHAFVLGRVDEVFTVGDRDRLKQLVLILLENAVKYSPEGGQIRLSLQASGERAHLQVQDTGQGISEADLPRVFERFYRADQSRHRSEDPGGTGLGLPIAKWIVEGHGGQIWIESTLGEGTSVHVELPVELTAQS